jgi:PhnB protein
MKRKATKKPARPAKRKAAARTTKSSRKKAASRTRPSAAKRGGRHKPSGYSTVSPYLIVSGAQRVIDFAEQAFDARALRRYDGPDGTIMHAEVRVDDTVVMMGDAGPEWPAVPSHLHVYVPDVDATFKRALAAGGVVVQEPSEREGDPDRRGGVKDPAGNTWWISTQTS